MKTSKFLICQEYITFDQEPEEYLLHNGHPRFLAKADSVDFDDLESRPEKPFADMLYLTGEGDLVAYRLTLVEQYERGDEEDVLDVLFEAREYYFNYMQMVDQEVEIGPGNLVKDFNSELPGLMIIHANDVWTVVYNGVVAEFESEESMDEFLENDLQIESELLDQGVINEFN